jgi:phosphate-selective porin OprO/OprP
VFWSQSARLKGEPPGSGGIPASGPGAGVGALDDGMFFRRVRLRADGTGYELVEFAFEVDFEQLNFTTYDHMWVGLKDVPFLGIVRVGQHKVPQGIDNMGSDSHLTLLERNVLNEGIWPALFAPGLFISRNFAEDHIIAQTMFHRVQPVGFFTSDFGDGDYASTSRVVLLPVFSNDGACVVHLGGSYQWRRADLGRSIQPGGTGNTFADTQQVVRFRARPELRDAIGVASGNLGGDTGRFVDTGFLMARSVQTLSPEFLWIQGPLSVQAEGAWAFVNDAVSVYPAAALGTPRGNPMFWGCYVETSYFLTGEHRGYDRRMGTFDRPKVDENAFFVRGEDGRFHYGIGAWQLAYRYSYLDLNDTGISGGQLGQHTLGLNWYLNDNLKVQFQYSNIQRNVIDPAVSGTVHGYGMLVQWYF